MYTFCNHRKQLNFCEKGHRSAISMVVIHVVNIKFVCSNAWLSKVNSFRVVNKPTNRLGPLRRHSPGRPAGWLAQLGQRGRGDPKRSFVLKFDPRNGFKNFEQNGQMLKTSKKHPKNIQTSRVFSNIANYGCMLQVILHLEHHLML